MIHPNVDKAIQEIDAAFFSGDTFVNKEDRDALRQYLERWTNEIDALDKEALENH